MGRREVGPAYMSPGTAEPAEGSTPNGKAQDPARDAAIPSQAPGSSGPVGLHAHIMSLPTSSPAPLFKRGRTRRSLSLSSSPSILSHPSQFALSKRSSFFPHTPALNLLLFLVRALNKESLRRRSNQIVTFKILSSLFFRIHSYSPDFCFYFPT